MEPPTGRTRWGMPEDSWDAVVGEARACLESRARLGTTITYSELCRGIQSARLRPYSWALMAVLSEVTLEQDAARGICLAALVVRRDTGMPGEGYFADGDHPGDREAREAAWRDDVRRVWDLYRERREGEDAVLM